MRRMDHPRVLGYLSSKTIVLKRMDAFVPREHLASSIDSFCCHTGEWVLLDVFQWVRKKTWLYSLLVFRSDQDTGQPADCNDLGILIPPAQPGEVSRIAHTDFSTLSTRTNRPWKDPKPGYLQSRFLSLAPVQSACSP